MKKVIDKLKPYILPFKTHVYWNIFYNILYALFGTLSFVTLIPMLRVLFDKSKRITEEPVYNGVSDLFEYLENSFYYKVTQLTEKGDAQFALLYVVALVIFTFLLKNLAGYLASYHMLKLRNGVMANLRKVMFNKIIQLPISFYSEKRKGDVMSRMLGDLS